MPDFEIVTDKPCVICDAPTITGDCGQHRWETDQMGTKSRTKGQRAELEAARIMDAEKISRAGYTGPDLVWGAYMVEVKRRADRPISMAQAIKILDGDPAIVVTRADRGRWYAVLALDDLLDIADEGK